jgi:threonine/homoserine/homoserine lactone efflux protein
MHGVLGLAIGAAVMAGLCSAGIGFLIRSSQPLFLLLKYCGVSYLFYLSYKTWHRTPRSPGVNSGTGSVGDSKPASAGSAATDNAASAEERRSHLVRAVLLQTSNPKSLMFFLSVLPQVAASANDKAGQQVQLALAIAIYCIVLILIHALYAGLAARARTWLSQPSIARLLSRLSAIVFFAFGATMLTLKI